MHNYFRDILIETNYNQIENNFIDLFGNSNEFFILKFFENEEFENFFKSEKLDRLITEFQALQNEKTRKNTSLFILIQVDNLKEFYNQNLNKIMQIEEDEYYFRKYVVFYTIQGLSKLKENPQDLLDYIQGEDSNGRSLFDKFEHNMFFDDSYFIAMQMIIKLPFISLPHANEQFEMIENRINTHIKKESLIESEKKVNQIMQILDSIDTEQLEDEVTLDKLNQILGE